MLANKELYHGIWLANHFALSQSEVMKQFHVNINFNIEVSKLLRPLEENTYRLPKIHLYTFQCNYQVVSINMNFDLNSNSTFIQASTHIFKGALSKV